MLLTSRNNPTVKDIASLAEAKHRRQSGKTFVEGRKVSAEALRWGNPQALVLAESAFFGSESLRELAEEQNIPVLEMTDECFARISQMKSPEGVAAVLSIPEQAPDVFSVPVARLVVAAGIQDPGNAGAIVRVGEAAGISGVVVVDGVDVNSPKFLRAAMGSAFRIPCVNLGMAAFLERVTLSRIPLFATGMDGAVDFRDVDYTPPVALCLGAEGCGIPVQILNLVKKTIKIPMKGLPESLNVAVAAGILLYAANGSWPDS